MKIERSWVMLAFGAVAVALSVLAFSNGGPSQPLVEVAKAAEPDAKMAPEWQSKFEKAKTPIEKMFIVNAQNEETIRSLMNTVTEMQGIARKAHGNTEEAQRIAQRALDQRDACYVDLDHATQKKTRSR